MLKSSTNDFVVLGCSALKKSYRDTLQKNCPDLQVVFLHTTVEILKKVPGLITRFADDSNPTAKP